MKAAWLACRAGDRNRYAAKLARALATMPSALRTIDEILESGCGTSAIRQTRADAFPEDEYIVTAVFVTEPQLLDLRGSLELPGTAHPDLGEIGRYRSVPVFPQHASQSACPGALASRHFWEYNGVVYAYVRFDVVD